MKNEMKALVKAKPEPGLWMEYVPVPEPGPGEIVVVPRGVEHRPVAEPTAEVVLFEPASTAHTGAVVDPRAVRDLPRL